MAHLRHLPRSRWIALALSFLLAVTAVHGAASVAVPVVAIAAGPASIGAALLHPTVTPGGRGGCDDRAVARERQGIDDHPRSAGGADRGELVAAIVATPETGTDVDPPTVHPATADPLVRRADHPHGARAPPRRVQPTSTTVG
ncbi:hypothetical protein [Micromonospora sp. LOL_023]|uniref:hypothetical protein n=1 Tax=Micromonospora sp. LOL_023 TaxID=3345418 RepID=UPI003A852757